MGGEIFLGTGTAMGALLGGAGASVIVVETLRRQSLRSSVLLRRWQTWSALAAMWLLSLSHPAAMLLTLAFVSLCSAYEYTRLVRMHATDRGVLMGVSLAGLLAIALGFGPGVTILSCLLAITAPPLLGNDVAHGPRRIGQALVGLLVAAIPAGAIWILASLSTTALLALLFGVALSDVLAFVLGSVAGSRKLAPGLSPNKTWAGAFGNVIGAASGVAIASWVTSSMDVVFGVLVAVAIALGSVWGDLFESLLKRHAGVKDAGTLMPGFGGVLDRFDSLIVAAPLVLIVTSLLDAAS